MNFYRPTHVLVTNTNNFSYTMLRADSGTNSPGHRPRASQIPGNNPLSWLLFPSGTGLKVSLSSERIRFVVSLGGGVWTAGAHPRWSPSSFETLQKSLPKSLPFFIDFGSQNAPKIHPQISQNPFPEPSRNPPPKKITKIYKAEPLQTLNIELSCKRGASFHKFTFSKKNKKVVQ